MEKISWNSQKKELVKSETNVLQDKLQELKKELMKKEMIARGFVGDLQMPMSKRRNMNTAESNVAIKSLRHKIAYIKNILHKKTGGKQ